jgi:UDP-N-acetylglucosamine acyltransferase
MELQIHPSAVIHKSTELADGVKVGPNCVIESGTSIGTGTILDANVVISKDVKIGENNHFFPNCVIGCQPQSLNLSVDDETGKLVIGNGNVFHEQVTVHPGMHPGTQTQVGNNNFIMSLHN